ncbi:MAG: resolvase [Methanosphaera stadtmanae]|jgi:hypothetical protein|nr:resolvase [Methanosphaera stadtmanae]
MSSKIHVDKPLSSKYILELLDENPDLEVIECPQSLYQRTSDTYIDALNELDIEIIVNENRGRPKKYDSKLIKKINEMINSGIYPKAVAKKLQLDLKTVYYLKDKKLKQGPKSKYSEDTRQEIIKLKQNGTSVKNISSKLNIPVRTIYHILKTEKTLNKGV